MPENFLDEVRLAVSEACSLAVRLHRANAPAVPIELRLTEEAEQFCIEVVDAVPRSKPDADADVEAPLDLTDDDATSYGTAMGELPDSMNADEDGAADLRARERIGLAVIVGLVDDVQVEYLDHGSVVTMRWPITQEAEAGTQAGSNLF